MRNSTHNRCASLHPSRDLRRLIHALGLALTPLAADTALDAALLAFAAYVIGTC